MNVPLTNTAGAAIAKVLYRASSRVSRDTLIASMFAQGHTLSAIDNSLARLKSDKRVVQFGIGQNISYELGKKLREYYDGCTPDAAKTTTSIAGPIERITKRPYESSIAAYSKAMNKAARTDDGHKVMTFLPMLSS